MIDRAFLLKVILSVLFISTMIVVLYFTVGVQIEHDLVVFQTQLLAHDLSQNVGLNMLPPLQPNAATMQADADAVTNNQALLKKVYIAFGVLIVVCVVLAGSVLSGYGVNPGEDKMKLIKQTLVEVGGVTLGTMTAEVAFLMLITRNYLIIDPNQVKSQVIQALNTAVPQQPITYQTGPSTGQVPVGQQNVRFQSSGP